MSINAGNESVETVEVELTHTGSAADEVEVGQSTLQHLKPADGGRDAWIVLLAGFMFEALFWGFPMCYGVFQSYYSTLPELQEDNHKIPLIGTLAQGLYYLGAPVSALAVRRWPKFQRRQIWLGWPLCILGLLCASFTKTVDGLIVTQGILYGSGFVTLTYPIISMVNEWWVVRKGMAFGLISAASGATGTVMPFIIESLLARYGYRTTLRASAVAMVILTAPLLPFFKARLPSSEVSMMARVDWKFLGLPLFWIYAISILIQGIGFFFPVVFLPSFAVSAGLSAYSGALCLALMCLAQVLGQFFFGYVSDKNISVGILGIICCVAAAVASLSLWGLSKSISMMTVFSLIYGFFGFGFGTLRVAMGRAVSNDPSGVFATYAIFVFLQGVGNILVTPLSTTLITSNVEKAHFGLGMYGGMVVLTSTSSLAAAAIIGGWYTFRNLGSR